MMRPSYVTDDRISEIIDSGLAEDIGSGDITTFATIDSRTTAKATLTAKESGVVAGAWVAEQAFRRVDSDIHIEWHAADGSLATRGSELATVSGSTRSILVTERLALNLLQRMSGIASATRTMVDAIKPHQARLLDTRKTAPGLRVLDKWAVLLGGGHNHRVGLFDMFLIKDNHIAAAGSITRAVQRVVDYREQHGLDAKIEAEASTPRQLDEILACEDVDIILLDNMVDLHPDGRIDTSRLARAVDRIAGRIETEASGNVTIETVNPIAATGVTYISAGALTHSVRALDISMRIDVL